MKSPVRYLLLTVIFLSEVFLLLSPCGTAGGTENSFTPGAATLSVSGKPAVAPPKTVTVRPVEIGDVLYNPGMGFADFQFGRGSGIPLPTPEEYPPQTVAYFRWTWDVLEPTEGQYNFFLVDNVIRLARAKGETLAFRIMSVYKGSTPKWLLDKGVDHVAVGNDIFPDHNAPAFLDYHERLVKAFGNRYAGRPEIDHVDIGSVGCWGEWNTACCKGAEAICNKYFPSDTNKLLISDWYFQYFPGTPLVMLQGGPIEYAVSKGAGLARGLLRGLRDVQPDLEPYGRCIRTDRPESGGRRGLEDRPCAVRGLWRHATTIPGRPRTDSGPAPIAWSLLGEALPT